MRWRVIEGGRVSGLSVAVPGWEQRLAARERPGGFAVMRQRWSGLLFLHWEVSAEVIAARLPEGLHVDLYEGKAWLGVVPFFMERVRPVLCPPVPGLSWFRELNVRTYVHDDAGNPGVWFFSLDCDQAIAVEVARRFFHLPYEHAAMASRVEDGMTTYTSRRKRCEGREAMFRYGSCGMGKRAEEGSLEWFLVERYLLFSADVRGNLFSGRVHHSPYEIAEGGCDRWSAEPLVIDGFSDPGREPESVLVAAPVDVRIFPLRRLETKRPAGR